MTVATTLGLPLEALATDAQRLSQSEFAARYAGAALLLHSLDLRQGPSPAALTASMTGSERESAENFTVLLVRRRPQSSFSHVTIGRSDDNDVVLPDLTLSKHHAYFMFEHGGWVVYDARSRNGTFVDGERAPLRGQGSPLPLRIGSSVRFGSVATTFLPAGELQQFVVEVRRRR